MCQQKYVQTVFNRSTLLATMYLAGSRQTLPFNVNRLSSTKRDLEQSRMSEQQLLYDMR